jgi:hypothetical protein
VRAVSHMTWEAEARKGWGCYVAGRWRGHIMLAVPVYDLQSPSMKAAAVAHFTRFNSLMQHTQVQHQPTAEPLRHVTCMCIPPS